MKLITTIGFYAIGGFITIVFVYILVRCSSRAFFRSYYEIIKEEKKNENRNI